MRDGYIFPPEATVLPMAATRNSFRSFLPEARRRARWEGGGAHNPPQTREKSLRKAPATRRERETNTERECSTSYSPGNYHSYCNDG